jgi:LuxR family maltose regulon positive regulatory protein
VDGPLLATKLHAPTRRSTSVTRPRLTERLAAPGRLVLVAAPAGFGKTSILTEWLSTRAGGSRVAWLSLDERDNDGGQFWRYLLAALDRAQPGVAADATDLLASGSAPLESVLATLVNDLHVVDAEFLVVLDDYHVVESPAIHEGMTFLVDNLPANVHLVIASRADPPLPLGRLRARGDLLELRAADLRFTSSEASDYLNGAMGLSVGAGDVAKLGERTEGWIAALQLAALSMQGRDDASEFIAGFAGDDRYVVDYLVEEVLQRQQDAMRTFLLQTSVLGRLTGDLCDAVTGGSGGAATLDELDRSNLFLVPLDDQREWYRYHHLFAEMLRARLLDERREVLEELHLRASTWFEQNGFTGDAIVHALEAGSFERAASLIKAAMPGMQRQRQEVTLVGWLDMLPDEVVRADPELGVGYAGSLLSAGRTDGVDRLLRDAESGIGASPEGIAAVRRGIALYRAARALHTGDLETAGDQSAIAVELSAGGSHIDLGSSHGLRGLVLWAGGELEQARTTWEISLRELEKAGHLSDVLGGSIAMGDILIAQGRLTDAEAAYRRGLGLAGTTDPPLRGTADMHVGISDVLRERDELEGARAELAAAEALGEYAGLPQNRHRRRMAAARLLQAEGDPAAGIGLLDEAEALYTPDFFPEVRPIAALRARLQVAAGRIDDARNWVRRRRVRADDELSYLAEFDHITLARVLLAEQSEPHHIDEALILLDRLLADAEAGERRGVQIEVLILRSLATQRAGRSDDALSFLEGAVTLAEPEGYVRLFADEGQPMARLLTALAKRGGGGAYVRRLQTAAGAATGSERRTGTGGLPDPLSEREVDVLRLLASDLSGPEISRQLVVSLNTLRTHTKNIYAKLGATSRREAIRRASELGLLNSPR